MLYISKQKGVKIAPMAIKRTLSDFYRAECFFFWSFYEIDSLFIVT